MADVRIGLMGGTFDPIHFGHLFIAEEARARCDLDKVLWIPNRQPAHREGKTAYVDPRTRCELVRLAIAQNPAFELSLVELEREGPSYAIDTLKYFRSRFSDESELFFIMGADSMNDILTWHRGPELFELCRFIATSRPGYDLQVAQQKLSPEQRARVTWLEVPGLHIASRELRARVRNGQPIRYLAPDRVVEEIARCNLYGEVSHD
ncbi:MAG: nicotinate-nucleotide adenylyltransferase [Abditibacteriota bacterium]|nr:nicotinate-nucleotide adenylyltransferase [Abditibacteriota bacterium]